MTIPKHLMEAKLCNKDTCEEIRRLKEEMKIKDGINETTFKNLMEERKENQRLNNVLKEIEKIIQTDTKIYCCSESAMKSFKSAETIYRSYLLNKLKELKESDK